MTDKRTGHEEWNRRGAEPKASDKRLGHVVRSSGGQIVGRFRQASGWRCRSGSPRSADGAVPARGGNPGEDGALQDEGVGGGLGRAGRLQASSMRRKSSRDQGLRVIRSISSRTPTTQA